MNKIKIAIAEDQHLFRNGLNAYLDTQEDMQVIQVANTGRALLNELQNAQELPGIILADMDMPDVNGIELTEAVQLNYPHIKVIILSVYNQERFISKMIEAGAASYLVKNCETEEVLTAIRTVDKSGFYFNDAVIQAMRSRIRYKNKEMQLFNHIPVSLTEREIEILRLICKELTNAEIAEQLHVSVRTVDGHRNNLLMKTNCKNTAGLVLFAVRHNIFEPLLANKFY